MLELIIENISVNAPIIAELSANHNGSIEKKIY